MHVELSTATKMFCGCSDRVRREPNTQMCPICLGLPGALPVSTRSRSSRRSGRARAHCRIASWCRFARKNYFYPDMPKNYQTRQYDEPIAFDGWLDVEAGRRARLPDRDRAGPHGGGHRQVLHVGGATGRIHGAEYSLVDYNRAGIPLIEAVTKRRGREGARA